MLRLAILLVLTFLGFFIMCIGFASFVSIFYSQSAFEILLKITISIVFSMAGATLGIRSLNRFTIIHS